MTQNSNYCCAASQSKEAGIRTLVALDDQGGESQKYWTPAYLLFFSNFNLIWLFFFVSKSKYFFLLNENDFFVFNLLFFFLLKTNLSYLFPWFSEIWLYFIFFFVVDFIKLLFRKFISFFVSIYCYCFFFHLFFTFHLSQKY